MKQHLPEIIEECKKRVEAAEHDAVESVSSTLEEEILEYLTQSEDPDVLYQLSPVAANLLEWYPFHPEGSLLELGAGCGTLTGMLLKKVAHVTAVEADGIYYAVNKARNGADPALSLIRDDAGTYEAKEPYDYVTLIGNLPYAGTYGGSGRDLLARAKSFLKPGGTLFLALPNKYGLKYLAGANEDYSLERCGGFDPSIAGGEVTLYTKRQLEEMIDAAGFRKKTFYYPVPDYRLPLEIYAEGRLPEPGDLNTVSADYYRDRVVTLDEPTVFDSLCRDGMYEELANSFLILCEA